MARQLYWLTCVRIGRFNRITMSHSLTNTGGLRALALFVLSSLVASSPAAAQSARPAAKGDECRVIGRLTSSEYRKMGGAIDRAIVYAYAARTTGGGDRVAEFSGKGDKFELRLPPGEYRLWFSGVGTRGATFNQPEKTVAVEAGQRTLDVGSVDLPVSTTTQLYGKPAPELDGARAWKNTKPGTLKQLRGRVVVLDFFAHYCTICHAHVPDLVRVADRYARQGLAVIAVHDPSVSSVEEMDEKMKDVPKKYWGGKDPLLPTVLDAGGDDGICKAYGISGVPAMIVIDQKGRVVRRFHHAGDPEFEREVARLLGQRR